jgi:uncharacterized membrane protein
MWLLIVWAALTAILVGLLIYRSTLALHEDNQIFLDDAVDADAEREQETLQRKMDRMLPLIRTLYAVSGALIVFIVGKFLYNGFHSL